MKNGYMGMVHHHSEELPSASVTVYIDEDGKITGEFYNLSDYQGNRPIRGLRRNNPYREILLAMRNEAREKAFSRKAYADARRRETEIENLKFAFCVTEGKHGHTIYMDSEPDSSSTLEGYGLTEAERAEVMRLKIPYFDKRSVSDNAACEIISAPMIPQKPERFDPPPWSSLTFAPLPVMAAVYERLGAVIHNITPDRDALMNVTGMTKREAKAIVAFQIGDEVALSRVMFEEHERG